MSVDRFKEFRATASLRFSRGRLPSLTPDRRDLAEPPPSSQNQGGFHPSGWNPAASWVCRCGDRRLGRDGDGRRDRRHRGGPGHPDEDEVDHRGAEDVAARDRRCRSGSNPRRAIRTWMTRASRVPPSESKVQLWESHPSRCPRNRCCCRRPALVARHVITHGVRAQIRTEGLHLRCLYAQKLASMMSPSVSPVTKPTQICGYRRWALRRA